MTTIPKTCDCGAPYNPNGVCTWRHDPNGNLTANGTRIDLRGCECDRPACPTCDEQAPCDENHADGIALYEAFLAEPVETANV